MSHGNGTAHHTWTEQAQLHVGNETQSAWHAHARALADWASRLVNRTDVWGGYHDIEDREKIITFADGHTGPLGKVTTRPPVKQRGKVTLTTATLERHFRATKPSDVVGLHTTSPDNLSRWGAIEIDKHDESVSAKSNFDAAKTLFDRLRGMGFNPLLSDSDGKGGYHLRIIFTEPVPTAKVFQFFQSMVRDFKSLGLCAQPETFPKQKEIPSDGCGNWLRLPGRHHTSDHWARVWNGTAFLDGDDAIEFILGVNGDDPRLIPDIESPRSETTEASKRFTVPANGIGPRERAYVRKAIDSECDILSKTPNGHRNDQLFKSAAALFGFVAGGLVEESTLSEALTAAAEKIELPDHEIKGTIANAKKHGLKNTRSVPEQRGNSVSDDVIDQAPLVEGPPVEQDAAVPMERRTYRKKNGIDHKEIAVNESIDDPDRLARVYLAAEPPLRYWRDDYLQWDGVAYRVRSVEEIRAKVHDVVKHEFDRENLEALAAWERAGEGKRPTAIKLSRGLISNVEEAIKAKTILPVTTEPSTWLDGTKAGQLLALENGLLDLDSAAAGNSILISNTPEWFGLTSLPYAFDQGSQCQKWLAFLKKNLEDDADRIAIVQEWFGLCLVYDSTFHKFLILEGEGANGKSVLCAVLEAMLGRSNCSFVPLELFDERFQLTPTVGKLVNIVAECGEIDRVGEGFLKSFVSGDPMLFDRKNRSPLQCSPTARIVIGTNTRPRFTDRSAGLWRRMILMPMRVIIAPGERVKGMDRPTWWASNGEMPGILNWAIEGLRRLRSQGRFTTSAICDEALAGYRLESNPARIFLDERCRADPESSTATATLYEAYKRWAGENGYSPLANGKFSTEIRRAFPHAERRQERTPAGRTWVYAGVSFDQFGGD